MFKFINKSAARRDLMADMAYLATALSVIFCWIGSMSMTLTSSSLNII